MTQLIDNAVRFKWRIATYFFSALFLSLGGAFTTSNTETTVQQWVIASFLALGGAFSAIKALFDQNVDTSSDEKSPQ